MQPNTLAATEGLPSRSTAAHGAIVLVVCACFLTTGAAGLVYEVVWNRVLSLHMGNTSYALATLLAVFMGGLALGAWLGGRLAPRGRHALLAYALLEIGTGLYCAILPKLIQLSDPLFATMYRNHYSTLLAFNLLQLVAASALLLLPTVLMGATLPILVRALVTHFAGLGRVIGFLYGINAAGAFAGAVLTGLVWLPRLGVAATFKIAIAINLVVGVIILVLWHFVRADVANESTNESTRESEPLAEPHSTSGSVPAASAPAEPPRFNRVVLLTGFFGCGFAAMLLQVVWTRTVTMAIGSTTYAFALIAGTFILGLSLGSWLLGWVGDRRWGRFALAVVPVVIGVTAISTVLALEQLPVRFSAILAASPRAAGASYESLQWRVFFEVFLIFIGPTLGMGALFPLLARTVAHQLSDAARAVGDTYTVNAVGTILGAGLTGFVLIPWLGLRTSILAAAWIYVVVGVVFLLQVVRTPAVWRVVSPLAACAVALVATLAVPSWDRSVLTSGPYVNAARYATARSKSEIRARMQQSILYYKEGEAEVVTVVQRPDGRRNLVINGKTDAVSFHPTQNWLGHLPLFLHPDARRVLLLGLGSGNTLGSIEQHDHVEAIDALEISRGVVHAAREFFSAYTGNALDDPRANLIVGDGRLHLKHTQHTYDVIVSQPSNVWIVGAAALFTRESFVLMRERLNPGGLACIWVQIINMPAENIRILTNTWADVWPHASVWRPSRQDALLFIGSEEPLSIDLSRVQQKLASPHLRESMARIGIDSLEDFVGKLVSADDGVRAAVRGAVINTDDNSRIEYDTPPNAMARDESARVWALFSAYRADPSRFVVNEPRGDRPEPGGR